MIQKKPAETDPETLVLDNIGPIEHLEIPSKPGTIVVLQGHNGCGKSTVLNAVNALVAKKGDKLESRDGTVGGSASGFGVTIKVARGGANRRLNDCVVTAIEDKFDVATLVDPGLKDEAAADLHRIKSLCNLVGATVSLEDLHGLVGSADEFSAIVSEKSLKVSDPIALCDAVKRDFEAAARAQTTAAENAHRDSVAKLAANDGIDLEAPSDEAELNAQVADAVRRHSELKATREAWLRACDAAGIAQAALEKAQSGYDGLGVEAAEAALQGLQQSEADQLKLVEDLERKLLDAANRLSQMRTEVTAAKGALKAAKAHAEAIAGWQRTIEATSSLSCQVDESQVNGAAFAVELAQQAVTTGVTVRQALQRQAEAEQQTRRAEAFRKNAERYRNAAQGTLDILAQSVQAVSSRIRFSPEFRLLVNHPRRGECFFADLSHGERWSLALDMVLEAAKRRGVPAVMAIPQEAWEGLDGTNRRMLVDKVSGTDLVVFTAEASKDDGPQRLPAAVEAHVLGA